MSCKSMGLIDAVNSTEKEVVIKNRKRGWNRINRQDKRN